MIESLDSYLSVHTVIWLLPIAFMFHDLEEIVTIEGWINRNRSHLHEVLPRRVVTMIEKKLSTNTASFAIAVIFMLLGVSVASIWGGLSLDHGGSMLPFASALAVFFLHAFTHIGQALFVRRYTPGVLTSIILVLPYSIYAYYRLFEANLLTWDMAWWGVPCGFICAALLLTLGHETGIRIAKNKS